MTEQQRIPTIEDIAAYYDQMTDFYATLWGESIHVGYWPDSASDISLEAAQDCYTDLMISRLSVQPGQRVLDVGCGTGEPAIRLSQQMGVEVVGITISHLQVARANARATRRGVPNQVRFEFINAMHLPYSPATFDAAWALESIFHMPDRSQVLREIKRVLRPGGRLVIAEAVEIGPMTDAERRVLWAGVQATSYITPAAYIQTLQAAEFSVQEVIDISAHTHKTLAKTVEAIHQPERTERLLTLYDQDFVTLMKQVWTDVVDSYQGKMGYMVFVAQKPA